MSGLICVVSAGFGVTFLRATISLLDKSQEMLVPSCDLRLGGRREAAFEALRGDCGAYHGRELQYDL